MERVDTANLGDTLVASLGGDAGPRDAACLVAISGPSVGETFAINGEGMLVGRVNFADVHVHDEGVSRRHALVRREGESIFIEDLGSKNGTYCNGGKIERHELSEGDKIRIGRSTVLKFTYLDELDRTFIRQMRDSALRDGLTKAFNKKYVLERLDGEYSFAVRHESPLAVMMVDLDHFKRINDTHGHLAGDHVLVSLTTCLTEQLRNEDVLGRYGGEEFVVVCRSTTTAQAEVVANRLRTSVESLSVPHAGNAIRCTASIGIAGMPLFPASSPKELIHEADKALYAAKASGRNRVVVGAPS